MPDPPNTMDRLLSEHRSELAAFARRAYERGGRGAVYLDLEVMRRTLGDHPRLHLDYLTPSASLSALADELDPIHGRNIVATLLIRYDPASSVVCIARAPDGIISTRVCNDSLCAPPEEAGQQKDQPS